MTPEAKDRVKASRYRKAVTEKRATAEQVKWLADYNAARARNAAVKFESFTPAANGNRGKTVIGNAAVKFRNVVVEPGPQHLPKLIVHETRPFERVGDPMRHSWIPVAPPANANGAPIDENAEHTPLVDEVELPADPERAARGAKRFAAVVRWLFRKGVDAGLEVVAEQVMSNAAAGVAVIPPELAAVLNEIVSHREEHEAYVFGCAERTALTHGIDQLAALPHEDELVTIGAAVGGGGLAALRLRRKLRAGSNNATQPARPPARAPTTAPVARNATKPANAAPINGNAVDVAAMFAP